MGVIHTKKKVLTYRIHKLRAPGRDSFGGLHFLNGKKKGGAGMKRIKTAAPRHGQNSPRKRHPETER